MIQIVKNAFVARFASQDLNRYFFSKFFSSLGSMASARFTMSWFYFNGNLSAADIVMIMFAFSFTSLLILPFAQFLLKNIGIRRTFSLHIIPKILTACLLFYAYHVTISGESPFYLLILWMMIHAFKVMFSRPASNAYFTFFGKNENRGKDLGMASIVTKIAAVVSPIFFGRLINDGGMLTFLVLQAILTLLASLSLGFDRDKHVTVKHPILSYRKRVPSRLTKGLTLTEIARPFMDDLFFIWLVASFSGDYQVVGAFYGFKLALDMVLSYYVGKYADKDKMRPYYILGVLLTSSFWLVVPFAENGWIVAVLQFSLGLSSLVIDIPYEREYHNMAKEDPIGYALWREICTLSGFSFACILALILMQYVQEWHWLMLLGVPATLAMLWMTPQKTEKRN